MNLLRTCGGFCHVACGGFCHVACGGSCQGIIQTLYIDMLKIKGGQRKSIFITSLSHPYMLIVKIWRLWALNKPQSIALKKLTVQRN